MSQTNAKSAYTKSLDMMFNHFNEKLKDKAVIELLNLFFAYTKNLISQN